MATDNPLASADRVIDQLIDERDDARDALASAVQDYRQAEAEVRALTARLDVLEAAARDVVMGVNYPPELSDDEWAFLDRLRALLDEKDPDR